MIAQLAGQQVAQGFLSVLLFIAILSINLGVINLLPIPILDGGHLLFFAIEGVMGRPISIRKREVAQQVGLFLLICLMLFAIYNDVDRIITSPKE
jgi:regulator of sigma E protease